MRKPIMAGNWKMHKTVQEAVELVKLLRFKFDGFTDADVVVCPPFTALSTVWQYVSGSSMKLGAQNCHYEDKGAFTGEVSVPMLKNVGCSYVIVGHSERRQLFNETDELVNMKARAVLAKEITPIICVGETLEEREKNKTKDVIKRQVEGAYKDIPSDVAVKTILAYEPVWAIGTGKTATPDQAQEVHAFIRDLLAGLYSRDAADVIRIQYGGSVKPDNVSELMSMPDLDGALVGGASLDAESFEKIVKFKKVK